MAIEPRRSTLESIRDELSVMSLYERFEQVIALALGLFIAVIIVLTLVRLFVTALPMLLEGVLDPLSPGVFTSIFGMIMTVLIAMEFKHSIIKVALRKEGIVQVRTVMLIALLALGRKFIILDSAKTGAATIAALAAGLLALGIVYWLMGKQEHETS